MSELLVGSLIIESNIDDVDNKVTEMRDKADNVSVFKDITVNDSQHTHQRTLS